MKVTLIPVTPFQQNCSLLVCEKTGRAAVVDPGGDLDRIEQEVARQNVQVEKVLLTHGHIDHCAGAKTLATHYGVPIEGPQEEERFWIEKLPMQSERFGFPAAETFEPDHWLNDGDTVQFGDETLEVYHCPGHTPGHVVFFSRAHRVAIVGDVLFAETDRPHRFSARQSRGSRPVDQGEAVAARRRRDVRAGPRPGVDVRRRAPHQSVRVRQGIRMNQTAIPEIYVSTDVEADGPIPGPHSMLSFASAAYTEDKQLIATFSANLDTLPGAQAHPVQEAWWKTGSKHGPRAGRICRHPKRRCSRTSTGSRRCPASRCSSRCRRASISRSCSGT